MNYVKLSNETKQYLRGDLDLIQKTNFEFEDAEFFEIQLNTEEVSFKVLTKESNILEFRMAKAKVLELSISKENSLFADEEMITSIGIAVESESESIYSVAINVKNARDFRFTCSELELVSVEEYKK